MNIRNKKIKFFGVLGTLAVVVLLLLPAVQLHAEEDRDRVRVGYFIMPGYQESTVGGSHWGFGYDYLQEIAKYTGWKYKFVEASWTECLEMLENGELDLVTYAKDSPEDRTRFEFSEYPMGMTSSVLTIRSGDTGSYYYNDFASFDGMKIGAVKGGGSVSEVRTLFKEYGISMTLQLFDTEKELQKALSMQTIDAIAAGNHRKLDNEKIIATFNAEPFYAITQRKNTSIMAEFDNAMEEIMLTDPYFEKELYDKYFEENVTNMVALTREEKAYVDEHKTVKMAASPDSKAMCYYDGSKYTGIIIDSIKALGREVGVDVEYVETKSYKESLELLNRGEVDLVGDFYTNYSWGEKNEVILTAPYMEERYMEVRRKGKEMPKREMRVATCENFFFNTAYISKYYTNENMIYYDTETECVNAVRKGEADVAFVNQYTAKILFKDNKNLKLKTYALYDADHGISIAVAEDNKLLCSIFNKAISNLSPSEIMHIAEDHTQEGEQVSLLSYIYSNPVQSIVILCVAFGTVVFVLLYFIMVKRRYNRHVYELAYKDRLTGLGNIYSFEDTIEKRWLEHRGKEVFIISMDISHFATINETYGRGIGDHTISYVGRKLNELYGEEGIIARSKVDNFLIFGIADRVGKITEWMDAIKREIGIFAFEEGGMGKNDITINYNFGVTTVQCTRSTSIKNLIDHAEMARKAAKRRNAHLCYFNEEMELQLLREKTIEDCMGRALTQGEFHVYYQPKYCMTNNEIVGAEALVRWQNKDYGFMSPVEFIPIFENNGFIVELDFYVMEQVYKMLHGRLERGEKTVRVSINQSRLHFAQKNYIERLNELRDKYCIPKELIELELTESIFAQMKDISEMVDKLKANGYYLSVDDFGAGYSSLNMLKEISIDTLKIDKDFLSGENKSERYQKVIQKVVELANDLNMDIICEGVEREEQAKFLQSIGCMYAQGYLYARPMAEEDFLQLLS
ncbi:periplasmic sensor diguanylate cyclase/phosphodiesterase [Kineothrix alysoides]|uniref:Periplasmic sensor diguanylate cyclase/phosphodiesterase n=1 Tax=Kineothrix alysoides TaxID=1469948 RepID=A0A4R1QMC2_9FIRM|nr:EAL domain-containing protein [Kineothrix alysoides]TCL54816.1 periplasmic sensor diguanylate cyclase/phosphodiesterase [Kineothrix alysoides]